MRESSVIEFVWLPRPAWILSEDRLLVPSPVRSIVFASRLSEILIDAALVIVIVSVVSVWPSTRNEVSLLPVRTTWVSV